MGARRAALMRRAESDAEGARNAGWRDNGVIQQASTARGQALPVSPVQNNRRRGCRSARAIAGCTPERCVPTTVSLSPFPLCVPLLLLLSVCLPVAAGWGDRTVGVGFVCCLCAALCAMQDDVDAGPSQFMPARPRGRAHTNTHCIRQGAHPRASTTHWGPLCTGRVQRVGFVSCARFHPQKQFEYEWQILRTLRHALRI